MPTQKKIETVESFSEKFKSSKSIFLADFSGINVADTNTLRRSFRKANVHYFILKNTLAKRSLNNAGIDGLDDVLRGMTAFAFSEDDPIAPIKVIKDFNKGRSRDQNELKIKGCVFEGAVLGPDKIDELSNLPSREVLLAQMIGMLQSPMVKLLGTLKGSGQKLAGVLESLKNQKTE
jgi:large subunit ribosomal protein L10